MPECKGECKGEATRTRKYPGTCSADPPADLVTAVTIDAIEKAREDCKRGCECLIDQKKSKVESRCKNVPGGREWTVWVSVQGKCVEPTPE